MVVSHNACTRNQTRVPWEINSHSWSISPALMSPSLLELYLSVSVDEVMVGRGEALRSRGTESGCCGGCSVVSTCHQRLQCLTCRWEP